ncbi:MAG: LLM class flavin-dependent oxidoreductase, partial [Actinomycetota bacterium]
VDVEAGDWKMAGAQILPRAVQEPRVPLWVGAKGGPRALRLIARHADGWNTAWRWTPAAYAERAQALEAACEREGRDPASVRRSVGLYLLMGQDQADLVDRWRALQAWTPGGALDREPLEFNARDTLTGSPERVHALIEAYADLGVEEIIVNAASMPFAVADVEQLELFAEEIIGAGVG